MELPIRKAAIAEGFLKDEPDFAQRCGERVLSRVRLSAQIGCEEVTKLRFAVGVALMLGRVPKSDELFSGVCVEEGKHLLDGVQQKVFARQQMVVGKGFDGAGSGKEAQFDFHLREIAPVDGLCRLQTVQGGEAKCRLLHFLRYGRCPLSTCTKSATRG